MAISTYKVFLMKKGTTGDTYEKHIEIKEFTELGGATEMLETTTCSDPAQTYIKGIQSQDALEFTANYTKEDYDKLSKLSGIETDYSVWFGGAETAGKATPTGSDGKYDFKGDLSVYITGGGTNEVVSMTVSIAPSTVISPNAAG